MASAAMLRSAARSLRLRQPLEPERCLLARRFLSSSSVPTELRSAGAACRARILDANKEQPFSPRETIITPRRHYSGGGVNTKELAAAGRMSMKLDEASNSFDTHHLLLKHLLEEKIKYDRLKRVLLRVPIFDGIAFCVKQYFSGGSDKEAKKMTESH